MRTHDQHMQRAIELARHAVGATSPNPLVGCVIVKDEKVVGEGWHHAAGLPHAEIEAINAAGENAKGATLYVTLEPCSHHGRTPPCTDAIIEAGISTVVYAIDDSNPIASDGAKFLSQQGVKIIGSVQNSEAAWLNRFYFHHLKTKLPYVIAKYAASLDGRIATRTGNSQWITGPEARQRGHLLRQSVDAILVGAQTVIDDNPQLTVRLPPDVCPANSVRHPVRIVLDGQGRIPLDCHVLSGALPGSTILATTSTMDPQRRSILIDRGIEIIETNNKDNNTHTNLIELLETLGQRSVQSVLIEGGQSTLGSFFDAKIVDEVWAFLAPMIIGGNSALSPIGGLGIDTLGEAAHLNDVRTEQYGDDLLVRGKLTWAGDKVTCSRA